MVATSGDTTTEDLCSKTTSDSARNKVPLELSLIVASNDVFTADSLVYAENNKILVSGVGEKYIKFSYRPFTTIISYLYISRKGCNENFLASAR